MNKLHNERYEQIKKEVVALFEKFNVKNIPIDCFKLANELGFKMVPFSKLEEEQLNKIRFCEGEAITIVIDDIKYIFYNDLNNNGTRQRFSIFHEIGHYVLGHKFESDLARLEANFFASYAIAPLPLVWKFTNESLIEIMEKFDVSFECASNVKYNLDNWHRVTKNNLSDYEKEVIKLFETR